MRAPERFLSKEVIRPMRPLLVKWGRHQMQIPTEIILYLLLKVFSHWHF